EPQTRTWDGEGSLVGFVVSLNLKRRHLTPSQRAAVAVDMLPLLEQEARERQLATLKHGSAPVTEKIPAREKGEAREHAGKLVGVNGRYVQDAKAIKAQSPEVFEQLRTGATTITEAKRLITAQRIVSSDSNEWYTPVRYVEAAREVLEGFDLDPASS